MEIRWLWQILTIAILLKASQGSNENQEESIESSKNNTRHWSNKQDRTPSHQDQYKEEFIDGESNQPHSRKKRLIWVTDDGRLALPPGTTLTMTPTIAMPLVRHPPEGFLSNITISLPVSIDFDKLGLTDEQNPLGVLPPVFARSFGRAAGSMLGNYIADYLHYRMKRDTQDSNEVASESGYFKMKIDSAEKLVEPEMPADYKHAFHGGERAILYGIVEDFLATFGLNGKACLLRTICEVHSLPLTRFGVIGEIVKLFLTASKSPFADHISDYVRAQEIGEGKISPGECFPYYKECPKGLFKVFRKHQYSEDSEHQDHEEDQDAINQSYNEIKGDIFDKKLLKEGILSRSDSM